MEPEEIDKLFKERLGGLPAVPSPDAWMRLQQKMEPAQKKPLMWIYYAAASVVLLILSGVFYLNQTGQVNQPGIAGVQQQEQLGKTAFSKATIPVFPVKPENSGLPEETRVAEAKVPAGINKHLEKAAATGTSQPREVPVQNRRNRVEPEDQGTGLAAVQQPATAQPEPGASSMEPVGVSLPLAGTPALAMTVAQTGGAIEVVVKRESPEEEVEPGLRENLYKKGALLKNIYKQARNLKNGESVELAALGLDKEKLQEETKEIKQKITNVISL